MQLTSTIACRSCGGSTAETMPTSACRFFYFAVGIFLYGLAMAFLAPVLSEITG